MSFYQSKAIKIVDAGIEATPKGEVCRAYVIDAVAAGLRQERLDARERYAVMCEASDIAIEIARIVTMVGIDGLPGPRDVDVAVDAIVTTFRDAIRELPLRTTPDTPSE